MTTAGKKYYDELNIFRALIIIWVVVGHSFDRGNDIPGFLHAYAYTFHMPAFFLLSGLLFASALARVSNWKDIGTQVIRRFQRLMVPYFFLTAVSYVLKLFMKDYAYNSLSANIITDTLLGRNNPNGGLWFLYALFIISVVALLLCRVPTLVSVPLTFVLLLLRQHTDLLNLPVLYMFADYAFYFFLGIGLRRYYDRLSEGMLARFEARRLPMLLGAGAALLFSIGITLLRFKKAVDFPAFSLIITFINIGTTYFVSVALMQYKAAKRATMVVGNYGMDIYMIGYYIQITLRVVLMSMLGLPYLVYATAMFLGGLLLPIPISKYIIRKIRLTRILILGDFKKQEKEVNRHGQ